MRIEDVKFTFNHDYLMCVLEDDATGFASQWHGETIRRLIDEAETSRDLFDAIAECDEIKDSQLYHEVLKQECPDKHYEVLTSVFKGKSFFTDSDAGGVKVGSEEFSVVVPNGKGDGVTEVGVFEDGEIDKDLLNYVPITLKGKFLIYDYDCGGNPVKELDGRYFIYSFEGFVAFVKKS